MMRGSDPIKFDKLSNLEETVREVGNDLCATILAVLLGLPQTELATAAARVPLWIAAKKGFCRIPLPD